VSFDTQVFEYKTRYSCGRWGCVISSTLMVLQVGRRSSSPPHPQPSSCVGSIMLWSAREGWISACMSDREGKSAGKGLFVFKVCRCVCVCVGWKRGSITLIDSSYPGWRLNQGFPRDSYSGPSCCWQKGLMGYAATVTSHPVHYCEATLDFHGQALLQITCKHTHTHTHTHSC